MNSSCNHIEPINSRRDFLRKSAMGLGAIALNGLITPNLNAQIDRIATAKRIIYLFQSGAPSQMDLFDYKPTLQKMNGSDLPSSVLGDQRLTGMSAGQSSFPIAGSHFKFKQHGESGAWISDLMPYTAQIADELCFIKSMYTEAINHDPAVTFVQTGSQFPGRPSMGSWLSYGLGNDNENLPSFVVLVTKGKMGQPLYARLWGNGFLSSNHQGVQFRAGKDPVLYLSNPPGIDDADRKNQLDHLHKLRKHQFDQNQDPEIEARIAQYEMAFKMQTSVPDVVDVTTEPDYIFNLYGQDSRIPGTFAANCLLARRLAEKGVKFIQLYHQGWDHHGGLPQNIPNQCKETDQASAALIMDLKQRGMLDDTLVIWGGEFGRTAYSQGKLTATTYGRDHHPRCFTLWMAGGGIKKGISFGQTDDFSYNIASHGVHVHDFQATILKLFGIDHEQLTFKFQGRRFRLTDVHGKVVREIIS